MRKAIYTVLLGKYDNLKPAPKFPGWDCVLFTDTHYPNTKGWIVHKIKTENPLKDSRKYKFLSHKYLSAYELVCYIDGSMTMTKEPPAEPLWYTHPVRQSVSQESQRIIQLQKDLPKTIEAQMKAYKDAGFIDKFGLYQNGIFIRKHNPQQNLLCETVYEIIQKYSYRDQLALPFAIFKTGVYPQNIQSGKYFRQYINIDIHVKRPVLLSKASTDVQVHHITPGRSDKNLGKAINTIINALPDNDWICIRDIDTMPPYHLTFFRLCEEIAAQSNFHLVGCITNRLGLKYQLYKQEFSNNFDLQYHAKIGKELSESYGSQVAEIKQSIAGIFMLFPKKVWKAVGGFPEGSIRINGSFVDYHFSESVRNKGFRIGIAQGIYLIHNYRSWETNNPRRATKHLD